MTLQGNNRKTWLSVRRGFLGSCPNCGKARLFGGYLKPVDNCPSCNEPWSEVRADDGPAWLTMLMVGHLLAPLIPLVALNDYFSTLAAMFILGSTGLVLCFALLPRAKGIFIAIIWAKHADGRG